MPNDKREWGVFHRRIRHGERSTLINAGTARADEHHRRLGWCQLWSGRGLPALRSNNVRASVGGGN